MFYFVTETSFHRALWSTWTTTTTKNTHWSKKHDVQNDWIHCVSLHHCLYLPTVYQTLHIWEQRWHWQSSINNKKYAVVYAVIVNAFLLWYYSVLLTATFCSQTIWDLFIPLFRAREMILFSRMSVYASHTAVWCCLTCSVQWEREQSHDGGAFYSSHKDWALLQY